MVFTGIVEAAATVRRTRPLGTGLQVQLAPPDLAGWEVAPGESVCVSGVCLTVAGFADPQTGEETAAGDPVFDLSAETLARTWFGELESGRAVNLERAMQLTDRLGGHLVSGHVDGGGTVADIADAGDGGRTITFEVDPGLERYLIEKGSVTLDGISLTVVEPRERRFDVAVIPTTLEVTTLGRARVGQRVNVEADLIGKWVERLLPPR